MVHRRKVNLEQAIEDALALGAFIGDGSGGGFVDGVEAVRARIVPLIREGDARRAVALLEIFIGGCYEKAGEVGDSGDGFENVVRELFCDWIRARQAARMDPAETARMLLSWMENDDYGYCRGIERDAVAALDRAGLAGLERVVRERAGAAASGSGDASRNVEILKAVYDARRDVGAYVALCETENALTPADCETLAGMCLRRRRPEEELSWVERGLGSENDRGPGPRARQLRCLKRDILKKLGRRDEALASVWEDYWKAPSTWSYDDLMKFVPGADRAEWHAKALGALSRADLGTRIDLLVKTRERERLAADIEAAPRESLAALSHFVTEPAAKCLEKSHPLLAAKLHVAMALRILDAKKSKYYDAALGNLRMARNLLVRQGRSAEWESIAGRIRATQARKYGFMPGFERPAEGRTARHPSFRGRARKRWDRGAGRRRGKS